MDARLNPAEPTCGSGRTRIALYAVFLLFGVTLAIHPTQILSDDAFFYLKIALNFANGLGITFNTIYDTNGFHPLWQAILAALALLGLEPESLAGVAILVGQGLAAAGAYAVSRTQKNLFGRLEPIGLAFLLVVFLNGMHVSEAHLNLFASGCLLLLTSEAVSGRVRLLPIALAAACSLLARLDNVFFVVAMLSVVAIEMWKSRDWTVRGVLCSGIALVLPIGAYLAWNLQGTSHLVPISGAIKSTFPSFEFEAAKGGVTGVFVAVVAILGVIASLVLQPFRRGHLTLFLSIAVLAHFAYTAGFSTGTDWRWYYVPGFMNTSLLLSGITIMILESIPKQRAIQWMEGAVGALAIAMMVVGGGRLVAKYQGAGVGANPFELRMAALSLAPQVSWQERLIASLGAKAETRGKLLVTWDGPGRLSYFSELRVLPLDGLMNNFAYDDELSALQWRGFAERHQPDYYVIPARSYTRTLLIRPLGAGALCGYIYTPLSHRPVGAISVRLSDAVTIVDHYSANEVYVFRAADVVLDDRSCGEAAGLSI